MGPCDTEIRRLKVEIQPAPKNLDLPADRVLRMGIGQLRPGPIAWEWLEFLVQHFQPHLLVLPEYVWYGPEFGSLAAAAQAFPDLLNRVLARTHKWDTILIAGTMVELALDGYFSHTYLIWRGEILGDYVKVNPTQGEAQNGLRAGDRVLILDAGYLRLAPLICADIFCTELFDRMREHHVNLVTLPTASPLKPGESVEEKFQRDRVLYQAAAQRMGGYLVKVCGVGSVFGRPLQGRSLVAGPRNIVWRVPPEAEDRVLIAGLLLSLKDA